MLTGCSDNEDVSKTLENITVVNTLPEVGEDVGYTSLSQIDDYVYEQQLAACEMYIDACNQTNFRNFTQDYNSLENKDLTKEQKKISSMCTTRRREILDEIEVEFCLNIYRLLKSVEDCPNIDAYVKKALNDVLDFYDVYGSYLNGDEQDALIDMLVEYYTRTNVLALSFLDENKNAVCKAAVKRISNNADMTEDLRMYVSENNEIIKALNTIYGNIPSTYANKITDDSSYLAKKLIASMETLSNEEKLEMIYQLDPTPSPTPKATPTPTPSPSPSPSPTPKATPTPTRTPTPTKAPQKATPVPTPVPTKEPIVFE